MKGVTYNQSFKGVKRYFGSRCYQANM